MLEGLGIELAGVKSGELTLRPTTAYGLAQARPRAQAKADDVPLLVAAPSTVLALPKADLVVEQLVIGPGLRGHAVIEGHDAGKPRGWLLPELFVSDDVGRSYGLDVAATTHQQRVLATLSSDLAVPPDVAWLEIGPSGAGAVRVELVRPTALPSGTAAPPWPTPAECLLAGLVPELPPLEAEAQFGVGLDATEAMAVVASVAEALLAVGVLPLDSSLLRQLPAVRPSRRQSRLARRFKPRALARLLGPVAEQDLVALGARLPLQMATAVLNWMVVDDDSAYCRRAQGSRRAHGRRRLGTG